MRRGDHKSGTRLSILLASLEQVTRHGGKGVAGMTVKEGWEEPITVADGGSWMS